MGETSYTAWFERFLSAFLHSGSDRTDVTKQSVLDDAIKRFAEERRGMTAETGEHQDSVESDEAVDEAVDERRMYGESEDA